VQIRPDERMMTGSYGNAYIAHRERTWILLPFIYEGHS
jgi:protein-S-isoprenylcysteine O-methyltransferase Ste14